MSRTEFPAPGRLAAAVSIVLAATTLAAAGMALPLFDLMSVHTSHLRFTTDQ